MYDIAKMTEKSSWKPKSPKKCKAKSCVRVVTTVRCVPLNTICMTFAMSDENCPDVPFPTGGICTKKSGCKSKKKSSKKSKSKKKKSKSSGSSRRLLEEADDDDSDDSERRELSSSKSKKKRSKKYV